MWTSTDRREGVFHLILRYLTDLEFRQTVQLQLNKGKYRHKLPRRIFFANQGECTTGDYEEVMNKANCLSLVSKAILYWNTITARPAAPATPSPVAARLAPALPAAEAALLAADPLDGPAPSFSPACTSRRGTPPSQ